MDKRSFVLPAKQRLPNLLFFFRIAKRVEATQQATEHPGTLKHPAPNLIHKRHPITIAGFRLMRCDLAINV